LYEYEYEYVYEIHLRDVASLLRVVHDLIDLCADCTWENSWRCWCRREERRKAT